MYIIRYTEHKIASRRCALSCTHSRNPHSDIKPVYLEGNNYSAQTSSADTTRPYKEGSRFKNIVGSCSSHGHSVPVGRRVDSVLIKRRLAPRAVNRWRWFFSSRIRINLDFRLRRAPRFARHARVRRARNKPPCSRRHNKCLRDCNNFEARKT